jgi:30S ribosomal protein S31
MGKGDRKTKRGKIWRGSTGKTRPKKKRRRGKAESEVAPRPIK